MAYGNMETAKPCCASSLSRTSNDESLPSFTQRDAPGQYTALYQGARSCAAATCCDVWRYGSLYAHKSKTARSVSESAGSGSVGSGPTPKSKASPLRENWTTLFGAINKPALMLS